MKSKFSRVWVDEPSEKEARYAAIDKAWQQYENEQFWKWYQTVIRKRTHNGI